jgi:hypothetical protein
MTVMEERLKNLKLQFEQVSSFLKIKQKKMKGTPAHLCKCAQLQDTIREVEQKYDKNMAELVSAY